MKEKILIKSNYKKNIANGVLLVFLFSLLVGIFLIARSQRPRYNGYHYSDPDFLIPGIICLVLSTSALVVYIAVSNSEIVVSNLRVSGRAIFGRQVDIPIDSISAVGIISFLKGVSVSSSSGIIRFVLFENATEIFNTISELLQNRQQQQAPANSIPSTSEELKQFKELLDSGIITQEEYDAKKKQILGL